MNIFFARQIALIPTLTTFYIYIIAGFILFFNFIQVNAQERIAPAYPLITHNPNFSIWSMTDELHASVTKHWTDADNSLLGVVEVDGQLYRFMGKEPAYYTPLLHTAEEKAFTVDYTLQEPKGDWKSLRYDASNWKNGAAPIGDNGDYKTRWNSDQIWVRRTFDISDVSTINELFLKLNHDDNVEVYLNGKSVYSKIGWTSTFTHIPLQKSDLKKGNNIIAIHLKNSAGGRYLDFGLVNKPKETGPKMQVAKQTGVEFTATSTIYNFKAGAVDLKVMFTSPLLMDDLDVLARPVSYITYSLKSNDNKTHTAKVLLSASSNIAVYRPSQEVEAKQYIAKNLNILKVGTVEQPFLQKAADDMRIDWGYFYVATQNKDKAVQYLTEGSKALADFRSGKTSTRALKGKNLALNTVLAFDQVTKNETSKFIQLGYDEVLAIQYFKQNLRPYWNRTGNAVFEDQLAQAALDYNKILAKCRAFDKQMQAEAVKAGGVKYAHLNVLAYRQSIAAHTLVESPEKELLWLSKENNSGGFINTVDVTYPSAPLYLLYNPELLKGMLTGIFYFTESGKYPYEWAAHDLGTYPLANGQTYGEPMPVEESGNMVILTAAIAHVQKDMSYAKKHWKTLTMWTDYLVKEGFDPKTQLCTDDFAGHLARNVNLSVKAIVGIACYAQMAEAIGENQTAQKYRAIADEMVKNWMKMADAGDHYALTFDNKNTWSLKYNLVWDKVLKLNLFPQEVYDKEINYYLTKQMKYGVPLDNRSAFTKNDWIMWTATFAPNKSQFDALVDRVYFHALNAETRVPLNDFYNGQTGIRENFKARSVVGGFFMKTLAERYK
ncbi:MAG: glutaminase domain-containing protein [Sphingobacterium composti]